MLKLKGECVVYIGKKRVDPNEWIPSGRLTAAELARLKILGFNFDAIGDEGADDVEEAVAKKAARALKKLTNAKAKAAKVELDEDQRAPLSLEKGYDVDGSDDTDEDEDEDEGGSGLDVAARAQAAIDAQDYHAGVEVVSDAGLKPAKGKTALFTQLEGLVD